MAWERLDESKLRNTGGEGNKIKRVYGLNGLLWPRLVISILEYPKGSPEEGFLLCVNCKENTNSWWHECSIPQELLKDAAEILLEMFAISANTSCSINAEIKEHK